MSARIIAVIDGETKLTFICDVRRAIAEPRVGDQTYILQSFMVAKHIFHMCGVRG